MVGYKKAKEIRQVDDTDIYPYTLCAKVLTPKEVFDLLAFCRLRNSSRQRFQCTNCSI
jgi:hypothetical protein